MSFLTGILNVGKTAVKFLSGNSIYSSLAKTAILGLAVNKLSKSALKGNSSDTQNIDNGVRLQAKPDAAAKIPVLYGSAFFGGNISDARMTNSNKTMWYCLVLSEKTGNLFSTSSGSGYTLNNVYWNNQRIIFESDGITANYTVDTTGVIDRNISGLVKIYFYAGGRTAGQVPSGYSGTVPNAETIFPNWTSGTHAMSNLVFALVRVDYNRERNITGIGNMLFNITNSMTLPGDVLYDYLTNNTYGAGIDAGNILTTDITALNTYSQDNISYDDQGSGAQTLADRYLINGLIDTANPVLQNAEKILSSAASWLSYDTHQGKWGIVINKADTSVASFDDSNILSNIALSGTGLQDLYNVVKVEFPHRELRDSADFYNIEIPESSIPADWADFSRNANEQDNVLNLTYDIINEPIQAQMLGLIELKQSRLDKIIQFEVDFSFYNLKAGDVIDVTNERFSFTNKLFRIVSITEKQDGNGPLSMEITALEYNVNVYSLNDLYRFTRSDSDGIITIGSIGTPGTPVVTKIEQDSRPRIEIASTAPTGIVEGMEFWLTTDVNLEESNRSYTLIGIKRPEGGGVYTSGTSVVLEYVANAGNFLVKTRGINDTTVGNYSTVSGLVEFAPVQVTDALDINTQAFDSTGALIGALALVDLIGKISDLFPEGSGGKSFFERFWEIFEAETGVNLPDAITGGDDLGVKVAIQYQSTLLTENLKKLTFTGDVFTSGSGSDGNIVIAAEFPVQVKTPEIITVTSGGTASICAGGTITVTADTQCLPCLFDVPNFTYPYSISGISASDIAVLRLNNVVSAVNTSGLVSVIPATGLAEIEIELANTVGSGVTNEVTITIDGKSVSKTIYNPAAESYNIVLSSDNIKEGDTFTITVQTQGVANGTSIPWTLGVSTGGSTSPITSPAPTSGNNFYSGNVVIQNNSGQITFVTQDNNTREFLNYSACEFVLFQLPGSAATPPPQNPCNTIVTTKTFSINERSDVWAGCRSLLPIALSYPPSGPVVSTQQVTIFNKSEITSKWCAEFRTADKNAANALWTPYYIIQEDLIRNITHAAGTSLGVAYQAYINGVLTDTTTENYFEVPSLLSLNISTGAVTVVQRRRISSVHASPNFGGYPYYVPTAFNNLASWTWPNYQNSRLMGSSSQVVYANFNGWAV